VHHPPEKEATARPPRQSVIRSHLRDRRIYLWGERMAPQVSLRRVAHRVGLRSPCRSARTATIVLELELPVGALHRLDEEVGSNHVG
jgi:hypothetical protein